MAAFIDANVVLRYLLDDIPAQAERAETIIGQGAFVTTEVFAEVVYVLGGVYEMPRRQISAILTEFTDIVQCVNPEVIKTGLAIFGGGKLDFVDCILAAYHQVQGEQVASFDKDLLKTLAKIDQGDCYG